MFCGVRACCSRLWCGVGDVNVDGEGSGPVARYKVRVLCSLRCTGRIGFWIELGSGSDVRVSARLTFSVKLRRGSRRW